MSDVIKEYFESSFKKAEEQVEPHLPADIPAGGPDDMLNGLSESSTYTLACDQSQMSRDVDLWLRGTTESAGVQLSRVFIQRPTSAHISSLNSNGIWRILALLLPFLSFHNYPHWRCTPSVIFTTVKLMVLQFARACDRVRCNIRRLAQNQMSRAFLATAMDVLLVVYAIGFLVISMYQASIIG